MLALFLGRRYYEHCAPRCKGFVQTHTIDYNFTLPAAATAGSEPELPVRILVDSTLVSTAICHPHDRVLRSTTRLCASTKHQSMLLTNADRCQVEAFVAGGRGAITIPTSTPLGGSAGVYLLGGALGSALTAGGEGAAAAVVNNATAWGMCM